MGRAASDCVDPLYSTKPGTPDRFRIRGIARTGGIVFVMTSGRPNKTVSVSVHPSVRVPFHFAEFQLAETLLLLLYHNPTSNPRRLGIRRIERTPSVRA